MLLIKPTIAQAVNCPYCQTILKPETVLWQGIHICGIATCATCTREIISDLPTGHGAVAPYQIDLARGQLFRDSWMAHYYDGWFGMPFLTSLQQPCTDPVRITRELVHPHRRVILLNCLDYLYGHCLLKLLNATWHLKQHPDFGLIVIVPTLLRWLVPDGVAEIWTVDLPLSQGQRYYPQFNDFMQRECDRFDEIYLSPAYSHPSQFEISDFSRIPKHSFDQQDPKITFIWREDRPWCPPWMVRVFRKLRWLAPLLWVQHIRVRRLFAQLRQQGFTGEVAIAGLGTRTQFPQWIQDYRVQQFTAESEQQLCQVYAESRIVIGVHGSSLLLPSGHAGMTLDLMPRDRWDNIAQDILYQEADPRIAAFRYRYLPIQSSAQQVAAIAISMMTLYAFFTQELRSHRP